MSKIWELSHEEIRGLVKNSTSYAQIMRTLGLATSGDSISGLKKRIAEANLDISHFNKSKGFPIAKSLNEILVINSNASGKNLKKRLIKNGIIQDKCSKCGIGNTWQNEPITLHLDHINGDHFDNRIENLRVLCPNCHSQTPTHGTRRSKKNWECQFCGQQVRSQSLRCRSCAIKQAYGKGRKVIRPSYENLKELLDKNTYVAVGEMFGVSDNAIRKWLKQYEKHGPLV